MKLHILGYHYILKGYFKSYKGMLRTNASVSRARNRRQNYKLVHVRIEWQVQKE